MNTYTCSGCGLRSCDGRCFLGEDIYAPDEPVCILCDGPLGEDGYCAACDEYALTETHGDPLLKRDAA